MYLSKKAASLIATLAVVTALSACAPKAQPGATTATPQPGVPTTQATPPEAAKGGIEVGMKAIAWPQLAVVARVNGVDIKFDAWREEVTRQLSTLTDQYQIDWNSKENTDRLPAVLGQVLDYMVDIEMLRQAAAQESIVITDADVQAKVAEVKQQIVGSGQYKDFDEFLQRNALTAENFQAVIRDQVLIDRLMKAHGGPSEVEQIHARHILVADEAKANEVLGKLKAGEKFEDLAKAYSTDTSNKDNGGDLGWFPRGSMVPEFDEAVFALKPGETSGAVKTTFGYHIIRLDERGIRKLEEPLASEIQQENFYSWMEDLRSKSQIERFYTPPSAPPVPR